MSQLAILSVAGEGHKRAPGRQLLFGIPTDHLQKQELNPNAYPLKLSARAFPIKYEN
jgi:hypothetical protein